MKRVALILAGGGGTRLRPLSSDENPKQFLKLFNGQSLMELTFDRVQPIVNTTYVSTTEAYAMKVREILPALPASHVIAEPSRRNTGAAIALSCFTIEEREGDCLIAILASDHYIADVDELRRVLTRAFDYAERSKDLVCVGIAPTEPNTGFGYLELGAEIEPGIERVVRFTEKPLRAMAERFVAAGNYIWNAAMFVWRASVFRDALAQHAPELARVTRERYDEAPAIAIDYALLEKARNVAAIRGDFGWSDIGSFESLNRVLDRK